MKRIISIFVLFLMIFSLASFTFAQDEVGDDLIDADDKLDSAKDGLDSAKDKIEGFSEKMNSSNENLLEKEIQIPDFLKIPARIVFGLKEDKNPPLNLLIILIGAWIGFFILILEITEFIPFFEKKSIKILASIIITILISFSGGIQMVAIFFLEDLASLFGLIKGLGILKLILAIIITIAIIIGLKFVSRKFKENMMISRAEFEGQEIRQMSETARVINENS